MAKRPTNPKSPTTSQKVRGGGSTTHQKPPTTAAKRASGDKRLDAILEAMTEELLTALEQDYKPKER